MSHGAIFLLLLVSFSSTAGDGHGEEYIDFRAIKPADTDSTSDSLQLRCAFQTSAHHIVNAQVIKLSEVDSGDDELLMVYAGPSGLDNEYGDSVIQAQSEFNNPGESTVSATFVSSSDGYSRSYICVIKGNAEDGSRKTFYKEIQVGAADTSSSKIDELNEKIEECCEASEAVKKHENRLEELTKEMSEVTQLKNAVMVLSQALSRYLSIETVKYEVSSLFNDHIYIASKDEPKFDLEEMNDLCKQSNGYLAELDDEDEMKFVADFVASIGNQIFAIGGNDVEDEGHFVYYNSKKPVPDSLWKENEPSNTWGNEGCVQVTKWGLNDIRCHYPVKYVCEIPLV